MLIEDISLLKLTLIAKLIEQTNHFKILFINTQIIIKHKPKPY